MKGPQWDFGIIRLTWFILTNISGIVYVYFFKNIAHKYFAMVSTVNIPFGDPQMKNQLVQVIVWCYLVSLFNQTVFIKYGSSSVAV